MINPSFCKNNISGSLKKNSFRPLALAVAMAFAVTLPSVSKAATYTVMNTNDSGVGSLRQAVIDANANTGADTILFDSSITGSTIFLTTSNLDVSDDLTVTGPIDNDPDSITISGSNNSGIFKAVVTSLTLENLTLKDGNGFAGDGFFRSGGAVFVSGQNDPSKSFILNNTLITGNSITGDESKGGGIALINIKASINNSIISGNSTSGTYAMGGGIYSKLNFIPYGYYGPVDTIVLNQTTVSNNSTSGDKSKGGGVYVRGKITLDQTTISGNSTQGESSSGGGLHASSGILNQSTVSGNSTIGDFSSGGGLLLGGSSVINNSTISSNFTEGMYSSGAGIANNNGITVDQSTISGNIISGSNGRGGGLFSDGNISLKQSTIVQNKSTLGGAGVHVFTNLYYGYGYNSFDTTITNTIIADNDGQEGNVFLAQDNTLSAINSLLGDSSSEVSGTNIDNVFINIPDIGPLQDNGGSTFTHLPNLTSPVINAGKNSDVTFSTDQRGVGFTRILNGTVDIGTVEVSFPSQPIEVLKRNEIVKPLLQAVLGDNFIPEVAIASSYSDVEIGDFNADWIEKFKVEAYTEGCALDRFCPNDVVTKEQLAKFIIKAKEGSGYLPMPATGIYTDVPMGSFNADWIEALNMGGMTMDCATGKFCPKDAVTVEVFENILNAAFP